MKALITVLLLVFVFLQYKLWFDQGGVSDVWRLKSALTTQIAENSALKQRNEALTAEVADLKHGQAAIEERSRTELGMIKKDETFFQIIEKPYYSP